MEFTFTIGADRYRFDPSRPREIAIPLRFDGERLRVFGTDPASKSVYQGVAQGDGCNCDAYTIIPHCHATHTECVGHIAGRPVNIFGTLRDSLLPATVISINPVTAAKADAAEIYSPPAGADDLLITVAALESALAKAGADNDFLSALIIRTLPNGIDKKTRDYDAQLPPYFSLAAMEYLVARGIRHLLIDTPSVDRLADEGRLSAHHIFWQMPQGTHHTDTPSDKTITELIYVPDEIRDGRYLLNLQIAAIEADAAPSRPVLFEVTAQ